MSLKKQFRSVIQWESPKADLLFVKFTTEGDEIKNASKLIINPGQGCLFLYEGKIEGVFDEPGIYDLKTSNVPFLTTLSKMISFFKSEHKVGLWFFRKADLLNIRWGTRIPITYNDPIYSFPVNLRGYGNYSLRITDVERFFTQVVAGQEQYTISNLQEIFVSRISQPITKYLATAKFSYAEIDGHIEEIAADTKKRTITIFDSLGFELLDFRIEGTSFDEETNKRIGSISDMTAEVKAAQIAGVDYTELQKLKALRDAANNEGTVGMGMGIITGTEFGKATNQENMPSSTSQKTDIKEKLKELKEFFEEGLISEQEYNAKKALILKQL